MSIKLDKKTWIYEKGNTIYVSEKSLNIKGLRLLAQYEINKLKDEDGYVLYIYNPTIKYYLNGICVYSCKKYSNKCYDYIILANKTCYKISGMYKYYDTNDIKFILVPPRVFLNTYLEELEHEDIYNEYE